MRSTDRGKLFSNSRVIRYLVLISGATRTSSQDLSANSSISRNERYGNGASASLIPVILNGLLSSPKVHALMVLIWPECVMVGPTLTRRVGVCTNSPSSDWTGFANAGKEGKNATTQTRDATWPRSEEYDLWVGITWAPISLSELTPRSTLCQGRLKNVPPGVHESLRLEQRAVGEALQAGLGFARPRSRSLSR